MKEQQLQAFIDATLAMAEVHKQAIDLVNATIIANMKYLIANNEEYSITKNTLGATEEHKAWSLNHLECNRLEKIAIDACNILIGKETVSVVKLVIATGFAQSNGEAKRLIRGNGVKINNVIVTNEDKTYEVNNLYDIRIGKKKRAFIFNGELIPLEDGIEMDRNCVAVKVIDAYPLVDKV